MHQSVSDRLQPLARHKFQLIAAALLALMAANLLSVTARKSITTDEIVLIPAAYYHWVDDNVHLIGQHPPLCKLLAGFPLLLLQPNEWKPDKIDPAGTADQNEWGYVQHFWQDNRVNFELISFWSRLPMILLTLALGALLFVFARDLAGPRAAVLAVALFSIEPTILAHGRIVQTDIAAAFGLLLTVYAARRYIRVPGWQSAVFLGAAAAIAVLAKFSMLVVAPALAVLFVVLFYFGPGRRIQIVSHGGIATLSLLVVINAAYFFHHRPVTAGDLNWINLAFPESRAALTAAVRLFHWIVPADFLLGIYWQLNHARVGHPAGLLGMYSNHGWWYYFPVAFFLKSTLPFLALSLGGLSFATRRIVRHRDRRWLIILIPFALYTVLMLTSPIDIGVRYYLPAYPLLIILAATLLDLVIAARGKGVAVAAAALAWMSFEAVWTYPDYIPYMNQFAFARPHWWYLSDSNVEWGDDSKALAAWLRARGETQVHGLLLGCFATLDFYQVNYIDMIGTRSGPAPRYTALGASFLNGSTIPPYEINGQRVSDAVRVNTFDSYRHRKPEAIIGNSIYVYRDFD